MSIIQRAADTSLPVHTSDARDLKKKNFPTLPMNTRVKVKSVADAVTSTSSFIAGHHANPLRGILGAGSRQKENVKHGENAAKSDIIPKSNSVPIPVPASAMKQCSIPVKSAGCHAVLHHVKAIPLKPSQPIRKNEGDNHHNSESPKDILRDRSRLRLQVQVSPSPLKNQYQKSSCDSPLGSQKALIKLPATATVNKLSYRSRDKGRNKTDEKMKSRSHGTQAPTTPSLSNNEKIILNPPIISPRCSSAKDYDYETDGYTVDLEIFSEHPGDKLPPLLTSYQPSVTATLELLKLRQGQNDEPCSSSRSDHRSFIDSSGASNSTRTQRDNECDNENDDDDDKGHHTQGLQTEAAPVVEAVVAAETIAVAVDQDSLNDSASTHQESENTDKTDKSNEGEVSEGAIDIDTISNESPDSDNFSYGSVGGWGNYVDEDVDVGDSNDFDDEEISLSQLYGREGCFAATSRPYRVAGIEGIAQVQVPVTGPNQGGRYFRSGHGEHSDFSISANTTVCLNSAAIQKIVRNLDDGIEYRNIIPDGPRKND
jgi:hypothetical protein